jgi:hypothetical protein
MPTTAKKLLHHHHQQFLHPKSPAVLYGTTKHFLSDWDSDHDEDYDDDEENGIFLSDGLTKDRRSLLSLSRKDKAPEISAKRSLAVLSRRHSSNTVYHLHRTNIMPTEQNQVSYPPPLPFLHEVITVLEISPCRPMIPWQILRRVQLDNQ